LRVFALDGGLERLFITDDVPRDLLAAILDVPHLVAIVPQALAIACAANTATAIAAGAEGSLLIEVQQRSREVARLLAPRGTMN
jgi:hypothetical protein